AAWPPRRPARARPAAARARRRAASRGARLLDRGAERVGVDRAREPLHGAAGAVEDERLREPGDAETVLLAAVGVMRLRVAEAEPLREAARVADHVVRIDPDERHAVLLLLGRQR